MKRLQRLHHILRVWLTEKVYGNRKVTVCRTNNDLNKEYIVKDKHYTFECLEYRYTLSSDKWYVPSRDFYMYKVTMHGGGITTVGTYPLFSSYHLKSFTYWHHLAIRAHIQEYIH